MLEINKIGYNKRIDKNLILVKSDKYAYEIKDYLLNLFSDGDKLIVFRLSGEAGWYGINLIQSKWFRENISFD
ncbi:hypothetical protein [Thalassobellus citreus]|uniref:hypothetical protein n=1 Tax=Thalassobellus citreus TaxID=3367752 RepID=UPI00378EA561